MSITVETIKMSLVRKSLEDCPQIVKDYVKALESSMDRQKQITLSALEKIKELAKEENEYKGKTL